MNRRFVRAAIAAIAISILASAAHAAQPVREEFGTILLHTPKDQGADQWLTAERCIFTVAGNASSVDFIGRVLPIREDEAGGHHRFRLLDGDMGPWDSGQGPVFGPDTDFDVTFFTSLGPCDGSAQSHDIGRFAGPFNEEGIIPAGSRYAVVTLANNPLSAFIFEVHAP